MRTLVSALVLCAPVAAQTLLYSLSGSPPAQIFGSPVARAGDVDGDGLPDLLIGIPGHDGVGTDAGAAEARRGFDGALLHTWLGEAALDEFGSAVAAAGDVDGDGQDDVLVGAARNDTLFSNGGRAYLMSGASGVPLLVLEADGNGDDEFGVGLAGIGDVTGDGVPDLAIGAHHDDVMGGNSGSVRVCSGADGSTWLMVAGLEPIDDLGHAVDACGDINLDGVPDFIAGAHDYPDFGEVRVYSGTDGAVLHHWIGLTTGDFFGHAVSGMPDTDFDGVPDLLVGAAGDDTSAPNAGRVLLFSGASGAILRQWFGDAETDLIGLWVDHAGDWNLDGVPDVAFSSPGDDTAGFGSGSGRVHSGGGPELLHWDGPVQGPRFDTSIAGLHDVDGDGRTDLAVAFVYADTSGPDGGLVQVLAGPSEGPWTDLGGGLAGVAGVPRLAGQGDLVPGTPGQLTLDGAASSASCALFLSLIQTGVPFKGGTLSAFPPLATFYLATDAAGALVLPWPAWPSGLPVGLELFFQSAVADPAALAGVSLSNLLRGTVQA